MKFVRWSEADTAKFRRLGDPGYDRSDKTDLSFTQIRQGTKIIYSEAV